MQALGPLTGSDTIVKLHNWRTYPFADDDDMRKYRLYLEYCTMWLIFFKTLLDH